MNVKELIKQLKNLPQDLPVRLTNMNSEQNEINEWVCGVECSKTGESGYEYCGEIRLITQQ